MAPHTLTERIPEYLQPYIAKQDASLYTPMDHASWRFILKIARAFFAKHAHEKYLQGLKATGISSERIPLIEEMDACLRRFNWRAVPVSGFIPPAVFMEFLSLGVLPIACDMRQIEHLAYTPAPDIVHEAAGHAPILADPEYADYLRYYGLVSEKAIYSAQDMNVYHAIRNLSDVKEDPVSTPEQIAEAQKRLDDAVAAVDHDTEATLLSRMGWWTFEYGLVGDLKEPKIYGAGLLSSVGESYHCMDPGVRKIPFSMECIRTSYDITKPQPQLFVAPDFQTLKNALDELAEMMAFKRGGVEGLQKAKKAAALATVELETGVQASGVLTEFRTGANGEITFVKFAGPTQLSYQGQELEGQGPSHHKEGFSSPIGETRSATEGRIEFDFGISVEGDLTKKTERDGKTLIMTFENCTVRNGNEILFKPEWGTFDMICGSRVVSVFGGAADRRKYLMATGGYQQPPGKPKTNLTAENKGLNELYGRVRKAREAKLQGTALEQELEAVYNGLEKYPNDWLLSFELLEMGYEPARKRLEIVATHAQDKAEMIRRGLELL